jgi:membrane-bound metal-dependent hydrolase YbcI (DUF457 family)
MLPPGHIAAGYLTAQALLHITHQSLTAHQQTQLLWWGMLFGFIPDMDTFIVFAREKAWFVKNQDNDHHKFITHAPVIWLVMGLIVTVIAPNVYWKDVGLLLWLGSWSHFLLDSVQYGTMWLWPFSNKLYAFKDRAVVYIKVDASKNSFLGFWWSFVRSYSKSLAFYLEILIIISAIIIYIK